MAPQNLDVLIYSHDPKKVAQGFEDDPERPPSLTDKQSTAQIQSDIPGLPRVREHKFGVPAAPPLLNRCCDFWFCGLERSVSRRGGPVVRIFTGPRG